MEKIILIVEHDQELNAVLTLRPGKRGKTQPFRHFSLQEAKSKYEELKSPTDATAADTGCPTFRTEKGFALCRLAQEAVVRSRCCF